MNVFLILMAVVITAPTLLDLILVVVGMDIDWLLMDVLVKVRMHNELILSHIFKQSNTIGYYTYSYRSEFIHFESQQQSSCQGITYMTTKLQRLP